MSRRSTIPGGNSAEPTEAAAGLPPTRRQSGGSRREASDRIRVEVAGREIDGWALNLSRGGVRVILDETLEPGTKVRVAIGEQPLRDGRVVWVQEEPDGAIVGFEFVDDEGKAIHQSQPHMPISRIHPPPVKKPNGESAGG
ncbi:MAG: PilZ domain-containing protein [Polyangiaceae bacterium]|nr:PilZ domain-containing protein [Polyangiaceae bacterium]